MFFAEKPTAALEDIKTGPNLGSLSDSTKAEEQVKPHGPDYSFI